MRTVASDSGSPPSDTTRPLRRLSACATASSLMRLKVMVAAISKEVHNLIALLTLPRPHVLLEAALTDPRGFTLRVASVLHDVALVEAHDVAARRASPAITDAWTLVVP